MVRRHQHGRAVERIDDEAQQLRQLQHRLRDSLEGLGLRRLLVAGHVDAVVVDVDQPLVTHQLPSLVLAQRQQVFRLDGDAAERLEMVTALLQRGHWVPVGQHIQVGVFLVGQRLVWKQRGHAQRRITGQHAQHGVQRRLEAALAVGVLHQLMRHLEPEGVRNHHEHPLDATVKQRQHLAFEERLLRRHFGQRPTLEHALRAFHDL